MSVPDLWTPNDQIRFRIKEFEAAQARAVREHLLGDPTALPRLKVIDNQIAALRAQITPE